MDVKTPKKLARRRSVNTCRICNKSLDFETHVLYLYGEKSAREGILKTLQEFASEKVHEDDGLSKNICRLCYAKIVSYVKKKEELHSLFTETERSNRSKHQGERFKRSRKTAEENADIPGLEESPSISHSKKKTKQTPMAKSRVNLAAKFYTPSPPRSTRRISLAAKFPAQEVNTSIPIKPRILPAHLNPPKDDDSSLKKGAELLKKFGLHNKVSSSDNTILSLEEKEKLRKEVMKSAPHQLANVIMNIPQIQKHVKGIILNEINDQCTSLCSKKKPSVLRTPRATHRELAKVFSWSSILKEMKERAPDLLDILATIVAPTVKLEGQQVPRICTAYALLLNTRNRELSMVQKMNTVILGAGHATQKTFKRLNRLGVTQTRDSLRNLMDDVGGESESSIKQLILTEKKNLRIVFDNIDFKILVNIVLKNHHNSDIHWMAHYCTFDRVSSSHLDDSKPLVSNIRQFENKEYLLAPSELQKLKSDFTVLVSRVLVEFFSCLQYLQKNTCDHIPHRYLKEMATKSTIIGLPILPYNQSKHSDVCQYLGHLQDFLFNVHSPDDPVPPQPSAEADISRKERILKNSKVPLCGDLLGRERVTGAKKTRLGCDLNSEKFHNIVEYPALWHTKQAFLGYIWEQLYKANPTSGREVGTLYHLRQLFHMTNVYATVKMNYKSAENLMLSATKAYLCCAFMDFAGLDSLDGTPSNLKLPSNDSSDKTKASFLTDTVGKFVENYVMVEFDVEKAWREQQEEKQSQATTTCNSSSTTSSLPDVRTGQKVVLVLPKPPSGYKVVGVGRVTVVESQGGDGLQDKVPVVIISVEPDSQNIMSLNQILLWPRSWIAIPGMPSSTQLTDHKRGEGDNKKPMQSTHEPTGPDHLYYYACQCIQLGVMLMQLNDTEKQGDGERSIINWKLLMLYFRSRTRGMKYAYEAMRLITNVKALYTEKMAHRIVHGQFVNIKGGQGRNYANDLQMEMLIKNHKVMLRGLCGNKTLKAVERSTKASHCLKTLVEVFDEESNVPPDSTSHTHASTQDDIKEMVQLFRNLKPFTYTPNRTLHSFPTITKSPLDQLDTAALYTWLNRHKKRLARDAFANCDDAGDDDYGDEETDEEDDDILGEV